MRPAGSPLVARDIGQVRGVLDGPSGERPGVRTVDDAVAAARSALAGVAAGRSPGPG